MPLSRARLAIGSDLDEYFAYTAYALLDGALFPRIKPILKRHMSASPKTVMEKGNLTSKVTRLISLLRSSQIDSRAKLEQKWESNPYFLLEAL